MAKIIGTAPNQVPVNGFLGPLAYRDDNPAGAVVGTTATQTLINKTISGASNTLSNISVASGGTGVASLTANNVIIGNGTSAVNFVAPSTSGNVLTSNGTTWTSTAPAASGISTGKAIAMAVVFGF